MNELRYQLDLMRAMNQKLSAKERMYRLLCDTMDYAYIYYSFEKNSVTTLGKWDDFFRLPDSGQTRFCKLSGDGGRTVCAGSSGNAVFGKGGQETDFCGMYAEGKKTWLQFSSRIFYEDGRPRIRSLWYRISPN